MLETGERETDKERERQRERSRGGGQGEKLWIEIEMFAGGKKSLVVLAQRPNEIKLNATGFRSASSKTETMLHVRQNILA